ncbi:MAG: response regulator [bacterium]
MTSRSQDQDKRIVLIVDDDPIILQLLNTLLGSSNQVFTASTVRDAQTILLSQPVQVILCDHHLEDEKGLTFLTRVAKSNPLIQRILVTGDIKTELLLDAINKGHLFRFLVKPFRNNEVIQLVEEAFMQYKVAGRRENLARIRLNISNAGKLISLAVIGILLLFIAILALGTLAFLILYFFKSALGIDLLPNTHLPDLI